MTRRDFSDHVLRTCCWDMTLSEFSQAVNQPIEIVRERAKAAGIIFKAEGPRRIGENVDLRPVRVCVEDAGYRVPAWK